jgi:hypothetical protein
MKLVTEELKATFAIVDKVDSHAGLLASQYVKLTFDKAKLAMSLCGLIIGESNMSTDGSLQGTFFADRRVFGAFLSTAKSKEADLAIKDGQMVMTGGKQKVLLSGVEEVSGYSVWTAPKKAKTISITPILKKELGVISQYAPITAAADHLSAVYMVEGYGIIATDQFNVAVCLDSKVETTVPLPVSLTKLISGMDAKEVVTDANGAGIKLGKGYLYQALSTRLSEYPLETLQKLVATNSKSPVLASFKLEDLAIGLAYLKSFVFGSGDDAVVEINCAADAMDSLFTLTMAQGKANRKVALASKASKEVTLKWPLLQAMPWIEHLNALDPELTLNCTQGEGNHGLRAKHAGKQYILLMADKG